MWFWTARTALGIALLIMASVPGQAVMAQGKCGRGGGPCMSGGGGRMMCPPQGRMWRGGQPGPVLVSMPTMPGLRTAQPAVNLLTTAQDLDRQLDRTLTALEGIVGDNRLSDSANRRLKAALRTATTKLDRVSKQLSGIEERERRGLMTGRDQQRLTTVISQQQVLLQALEPYRQGAADVLARKQK